MLTRRTKLTCVSLILAGCGSPDLAGDGTTDVQGAATAAMNGLTGINGLSSTNGFRFNRLGLNSYNGLPSIAGVNSSNSDMMSTADGRMTLSYLVRCALPPGRSVTKQDPSNNWYTYQGGIGVAPEWETGECGVACQQAVSACMMAHVNTAGVHIPLWLVSPSDAIGWGQNAQYSNREGTFFGNIFTPNSKGTIDAFYCNGKGFDKDTVPGRLGAYQKDVPYTDPFVTAANPNGYCLPCASSNPDGPDSCSVNGTTFNSPVTVWRGQAFQAENLLTAIIKSGTVVSCTNCSNGKRLSNITGPVLIPNIFSSTTGTRTLLIYYTNGDAVAHTMLAKVGNTTSKISFPPTGAWDKVSSVMVTASGFKAGSNNLVTFVKDGNTTPVDLDWVEIE